jgi:phosphoserine phosphatase RsbU/P
VTGQTTPAVPTATHMRRVPLAADLRSPAAARSAVRSVATEAGLSSVLDEALLLTTELVTNAVVHAGTDITIEITADSAGLTITVLDDLAGPLVGPGLATESDERGRGLLLVDQIASQWGTVHHPAGKGVWFRLDRVGVSSRVEPPAPAPPWPMVDPVAALGSVPEGLDLPDQLAELLRRLTQATGADAAAVLVDDNDGTDLKHYAAYGVVPANGAGRTPLRVARPWRAELVMSPVCTGPLVDLAAERIGLLLEIHRLRRAELARRSSLNFLVEVSDLLAQSLDVDLTLALIPRLVVPRLGQWCAVHVLTDDGELSLAASTHIEETAVAKLLDLLDVAQPQLREALALDSAVPLAAPADGICVALIARGQRIGTLAVGRDLEGWQGPDQIAAIEDIARRAALAIDNNRIYAERREIAQALQRSLLPPALPTVEGIDLGAEYVPAGEAVDVGGDFYDIVELPDGRWLVVIGDVSGKGVHAATVTGLVRDVTRVLVRDGRPLPETLARLNDTLVERGAGRFCTLALATLNRRADGLLDVALHLAGHDQAILVNADGGTRLVGRCGTALGLLRTVRSPVEVFTMNPGDMLIFNTDGVTERRHQGVLFGIERLRIEASALAGFPAEVVAARLRAAAVGFSPEPPRDDIAVLTVRNET